MYDIISYSAQNTLVGDVSMRTQIREDGVWFVAKDIAQALGYKWKGHGTIKHIPEPWRTMDQIATAQGLQEMVLISEQGLYFFLNRSDKPAALPFQMWVNGTVLPELRKQIHTVTYQQPELTQLQVLQVAINNMVEQERRMVDLASKQMELSSQVSDLIQARAHALKALAEAPEPKEAALDLPLRGSLGRVVKEFGKATGCENFADLWNRLYMEFRDRYHVDLKAQAENRGVGPLDIAEEQGLLEKLYSLAYTLFRQRNVLPTGSLTWVK